MIRYLEQEEKNRARNLYEACFPEDDRAFVDYYFTEKTKDNRILVMEEETRLQVMVHLNPYCFWVCGEKLSVNYIVAVATEKSVRKQGKMRKVLHTALQDMAKAHQPFTFLIPANPLVYVSSGFVPVSGENYEDYRNQLIVSKEEPEAELEAAQIREFPEQKTLLRPAKETDLAGMVSFSNELLEQEYDLFPLKSEASYRRAMAETESQEGGLVLMKNADELSGIFSYEMEDGCAQLQEILVKKELRAGFGGLAANYFKETPVRIMDMNFMVRILDLQVLCLLLRSEEPFSLKVQVTDPVIASNCGCFEIRADQNGSSITAIPEKEAECTMEIGELTGFLFGKMKLMIREWV